MRRDPFVPNDVRDMRANVSNIVQWYGLYYLLYGKQNKLTKSVHGTEAAGRNKTKWNKENRMTRVVTAKPWSCFRVDTYLFLLLFYLTVNLVFIFR